MNKLPVLPFRRCLSIMSNIQIYKNIVAIHPGYYIDQYLDETELSQRDFASRMNVSASQISKLINGQQNLTPKLISSLANVLGTSLTLWENLNNNYLNQIEKIKEAKSFQYQKSIYKNLNYSFWQDLQIVPQTKNISERISNLSKFLHIESLDVLKKPDLLTQYRHSGNKSNVICTNAWLLTAIEFGNNQIVDKFDKNKLESNINKLRNLTNNSVNDVLKNIKAILNNAGVVFVALPDLPGTGINGAVKWKNKQQTPILMLNNRGKRDDIFWFSLFHEIEHIFQNKSKMIVSPSETVSSNTTLERLEKDADDFARDALINEHHYQSFIDKKDFSAYAVKAFASQENIAPGIVVGRLQKEGVIPYNRLNDLKRKLIFEYDFENIYISKNKATKN